ncbi:MAG: hypothetical protein IJ861_01645 [Clostridia bacterium]|nr:hypothetical protein [Clostridia bacterium]
MEMKNAFDVIINRAEQPLLQKGYNKENVAQTDKELTALYIGEDIAYSIVYTYQNKRLVLRSCGLSDGEPDNDWRTLATWLYDPETDGSREAESIGDDFAETIRGPKQTAAQQKQKKRKKDGENTVNPLFLANRLVTYFPELKEEIAYEKAHYEDFRGITFAEEKIVPRFKELAEKSNQGKLEKISAGLAAIYKAGDLDTKGIITYLLLNCVESDEKFEVLISAFEDNNKKIAKAARKLRGKKIKPEKPKKTRSYITDTLNNR